MKKVLLGSIVAAIVAAAAAGAYWFVSRGGGDGVVYRLTYVPAKEGKNDRWGMLGMDGEFLVANEWKEEPSLPVDGIVRVPGKEGFEFYTAERKPKQIGGTYYRASLFSEGVAAVVQPGGTIAWIDTNGNEVLGLKDTDGQPVERVAALRNGLAPYQNAEGKWGYLDKAGQPVIPAKYAKVGYFDGGHAVVAESLDKNEGTVEVRYDVIDARGERVFSAPADATLRFELSNGRVAYVSEGDVGFLDLTGEKAIKATSKFHEVLPFFQGYASFGDGEDWGVIDRQGEVVLRNKFEWAFYAGGLVMVTDRGKRGFVNLDGEEIIRPQYDQALPFFGATTFVKEGRKYLLIDKKGVLVTKNDYANLAGLDRILTKVLGWSLPADKDEYVESDFVDFDTAVAAAFKELTPGRINGVTLQTRVTDAAMAALEADPKKLPTYGSRIELPWKQVSPYVSVRNGVSFTGDVQRSLYRPRNAYYGDTYKEFVGYEPDEGVTAVAVGAEFDLSGKAMGKGELLADALKNKLTGLGYTVTADSGDELVFSYPGAPADQPSPARIKVSPSWVAMLVRLRQEP